jgi:hypothetical protein
MRNRFTRVCYAVSAAAVVTIGLAATGTASAAPHGGRGTSSCGLHSQCIDVFSDPLGSGQTMNAYVPGDTGIGGKVGQKVNMHAADDSRPNGDWFVTDEGDVATLCTAGVFPLTSWACVKGSGVGSTPDDEVYQFEWAPFGSESGLCAGVAFGGVNGESVTLRDCRETPKQLWIVDEANYQATLITSAPADCIAAANAQTPPVVEGNRVGDCPLVQGADTATTNPLIMTLNTGSSNPQNQLFLSEEGSIIKGRQLFGAYYGATP